jgi:carbamoyltransferase
MYILGINTSHDSSTCLMKDGKILFLNSEDRFNRIKRYFLAKADISKTLLPSINEIKKYTDTIDYLAIGDLKGLPSAIWEKILAEFFDAGIKVRQVYYEASEHHVYHAYNGFYNSKFKDATTIIMDGAGGVTSDPRYREIETIYQCDNQRIKEIFKHSSSNHGGVMDTRSVDVFGALTLEKYKHQYKSNRISVGMLFNELCWELGLGDGENAGKLMGWSSYGVLDTEDSLWTEKLDDLLWINLSTASLREVKSGKQLAPRNNTKYTFQEVANIAKRLQHETKLYAINRIKLALKLCNTSNIVLSGGYFLNCVNNYEYLKEFPDVNFYIDPIAWDAGTAIGIAMKVSKDLGITLQPYESIYLGSTNDQYV